MHKWVSASRERRGRKSIFFLGTSTDGEFRKKVQHHQLEKSDEAVIINGGWLSDIHINSAQALIKQKHPYIEGLENCVLAKTVSQCQQLNSSRF